MKRVLPFEPLTAGALKYSERMERDLTFGHHLEGGEVEIPGWNCAVVLLP